MADTIVLRCPRCKIESKDLRRDTDYHDTHTVEIVCPSCDDGDFHEEVHLDATGKHITRDPDKEARHASCKQHRGDSRGGEG